MVNLRPSFEQAMMGPKSPLLHTKFRGNTLRVFTMYGPEGHLGHVTQMPRTNCSSYVVSTQNLALIGKGVSEKMFAHCE